MDDLKAQAERFGSEIWNVDCDSIDFNCYPYQIHLSNATIAAKSIIIATGAESLWLNARNEDQFQGLGISTCATCDGALFKNEDVVVVGGGDSAMEEATFLTKFAKSVTVLNRSSKLRASKVPSAAIPSPHALQVMQERARSNSKIHLLTNRVVNRWLGKEKTLEGVEITNTVDQTVQNVLSLSLLF
jgi:thioredoxin reductase (NADPH)